MKWNIKVTVVFFTICILSGIPWQGSNTATALEGNFQSDETSENKFCITETPLTGSFPIVQLKFRSLDPKLNPVLGLSDNELRISENGQIAVPLTGGIQTTPADLGSDFYFVINKGNRTDQSSARSILDSFLNYYDQNKDRVYIYTDEGNSANLYFNPNSGIPFTQAVGSFPSDRIGSYRISDTAIQTVLNEIEASDNNCQRPKFLFVIVGDGVISESKFVEYAKKAKSNFTKIIVLHAPTKYNEPDMEYVYRGFVETASGYYAFVPNGDFENIFKQIDVFRQSYSVKYRSNYGASGQHNIDFVYQGVNAETRGVNYYSVNLLPPQITLLLSTTIERTAVTADKTGYDFDKSEETGSVQLSFPDGYPRKLNPTAVLIVNQPGQPELRYPVNLSSTSAGSDVYQFNWSLGSLGEERQKDISVKIEVVDELNSVVLSPDVPVTILTFVPLRLLAERYFIYILLAVVLILIAVIIILRRQIAGGIAIVGARVTEIGEVIRKTIVGGGKRGKPLAILHVIDGPQNMIGQELKVYTEAVKLGRDPQRADMTFYAPDANSSVSGYHARIERVSGAWRIVSVSQNSETFIDDMAIPSNAPHPLQDGSVIRLGYLAQQPVVFSFGGSIIPTDAPQKTTSIAEEGEYRETDLGVSDLISGKKTLTEVEKSGDDIFDEFRR
jgi:hypothetical protein